LVERRCAHRGADLSLGRLEDGGLRCYFHGWLFAGDGSCLEVPAEPVGSTFASKVRITSYPVRERNGIYWAYLGPGEPPNLPALDCFTAPDEYAFAFKGYLDCNWLQALEVGIDPAHASYLHRFEHDGEDGDAYGSRGHSLRGDDRDGLRRLLHRDQETRDRPLQRRRDGLGAGRVLHPPLMG
jgi:phthalate 4,5-dioxygenase oxygenase subunit